MWRMAAWVLSLGAVAGIARADNVLVLPFFNLSKDPSINWIGESLSERVREALALEGMVTVGQQDRQEAYDRLSLQPYKILTIASVVKIGDALDAEQVVFGEYELRPAP